MNSIRVESGMEEYSSGMQNIFFTETFIFKSLEEQGPVYSTISLGLETQQTVALELGE